MIKRDELIRIGQFNKPHGVRGELSFTFTDDVFDRSECPYLVCLIDGIFVPFFIQEYRFRSDTTALIKLEDVNSEDEARLFTNLEVFFPKSEVSGDEEEFEAPGDYFIGYRIIEQDAGDIGVITGIDDSTENVLFVVESEGGELLIPAVDDFVLSVDEEKKVMQMSVPDGLLNLNG